MSALVILLILGIWTAVLYNAGYYLSGFVQRKWIRQLVGVAAVIGMTTLALWDEVRGVQEFEQLCKKGAIYQIAPDAVGKKFDLKSSYSDYKKIPGLTRPVEEKTITYTDVTTGEVKATGTAYFAKGGWMIRRGFLKDSSGGDGPLFGRPQCFPWGNTEQALRIEAITNKRIN
jgi:hypothetical protein